MEINDKEPFLDVVLSVDPIDEDFDPKNIPADGMQYLQHVQ